MRSDRKFPVRAAAIASENKYLKSPPWKQRPSVQLELRSRDQKAKPETPTSSRNLGSQRSGPLALGFGECQKSFCRPLLEPISKSSEEDNEAGELDKAEEVLSVVLPADEDATLPLYPARHCLVCTLVPQSASCTANLTSSAQLVAR